MTTGASSRGKGSKPRTQARTPDAPGQQKRGGSRPGAGRPSDYRPELAELICTRIANGETLMSICSEPGMPDRITVWRWLDKHPEFATLHARARETQGDVMDERILAAAESVTPETANADRVRIDAYKWRAERLAPKRYGQKLDLSTSAPLQVQHGGTVTLSPDEAYRRLLDGNG